MLVQTACKQNYQDEKSIQEMKTACNAAVANAKVEVTLSFTYL